MLTCTSKISAGDRQCRPFRHLACEHLPMSRRCPFTAVRMSTKDPFEPGIAPLISNRPFQCQSRDLQVLDRLAPVAIATGHPHSAEDTTRRGASTDRTRLAVVAVSTGNALTPWKP